MLKFFSKRRVSFGSFYLGDATDVRTLGTTTAITTIREPQRLLDSL